MLLLLCNLSFFLTTYSQNPEETYRFGMEQYALKNYETATLAFERVLYFGNGQNKISTLDHLAKIRLAKGDVEGALKFYLQASVTSDDYAEKSWFTLRKCACLIALHRNKFAFVDLYDLSDNLPDSTIRYKHFLLGSAYFYDLNFNESRISFKQALAENDIQKRNQLDSLFHIVQHIKNPNPRTARILSMMMPGLGQFYSGDIKNGINSFLLTGAFIALGINTGLKYGLINSFFSVVPWYQRYYMGGFNRAERIAAQRLEEKRDAIYQQVLNLYD